MIEAAQGHWGHPGDTKLLLNALVKAAEANDADVAGLQQCYHFQHTPVLNFLHVTVFFPFSDFGNFTETCTFLVVR
jgi:hypothetical protein